MKPIKNPCHQPLSNMQACKGGYFCGACNKVVHDLSRATTAEVNEFIKENPSPCVIINNRHQHTQRWIYRMINGIEKRLWNLGLRKTAVVCTVVLLTISGCHSRRKRQQVVGYFKAEYRHEAEFHQNNPAGENNIKR